MIQFLNPFTAAAAFGYKKLIDSGNQKDKFHNKEREFVRSGVDPNEARNRAHQEAYGKPWTGKQFTPEESKNIRTNLGAGQNMAGDGSGAGYRVNRDSAEIPGYNHFESTLGARLMGLNHRQAPTMQAAQIDPSQQAQFRDGQGALANMLFQQAQGQGPSLAQAQLQQATDRNMAQALAMAQIGRGAGAAGTMRQVANQRAMIGQQMAGDSAQLRMQEQMQAQGALGNVLANARGQDIGLASGQAQLQQGANQSNQAAALQNQAQVDAMTQYFLAQGMSLAQAQQQARMQLETLLVNQGLGQATNATENARVGVQQQQANAQMFGALSRGASDMMATAASAFSDERLKTDVKPGGHRLYELLDKASAHDYRYKDPKHGDPRISVMAQELERSELGRQMVRETPEGKIVDYGKSLGMMLASQTELHKRLKKLEGK